MRIVADSALGAAKSKKSWQDARGYVQLAQAMISIYETPEIRSAAEQMTQSNNTEYHMRVEMLRDRAKYWQFVGGLTGNSQYLTQAIQTLDQAITLATDNTSAKNVAIMEQFSLQHSTSWEGFQESFAGVLASQTGGSDRKRAMAYLYTGAAFKTQHWQEALRGAWEFLRWDREYQRENNRPPSETVGYIARKMGNARNERLRRRSFQESGEDIRQFALAN